MGESTWTIGPNARQAAVVGCCAVGCLLVATQVGCKNHNYPPPPTPYPPASMSAQTPIIGQPPLQTPNVQVGIPPQTTASPASMPAATANASQLGAIAASRPVQAPTTGGASVFAQQQTNPQLVELRRQVQQLNESNRQLSTQASQAQRQAQAFRERSELLAQQLQDATNQNRRLLAANPRTGEQYSSQFPDSQSRVQQNSATAGSTRLTANNSLRGGTTGSLSPLNIRGAQVYSDRNSTRIRIPADQLFNPGTAQRNPAGDTILVQVAEALINQYPSQRVAVEGHTDNSPVSSTYGTAYQLSGAQAQAVMDHLVRRSGVPMQQLFVVAHGPNRPVSDNQTAAGRADNRRIEIVINPVSY